MELVRLSQLSIITNILTHVNNKICQSRWVCSALVSVPRPVTRWNSSTETGHELCCCPESGLCPGETAGGEETVKWLEGDGTRPLGVSRSSSPGTFHLSPLTAHSSQSLNNSIIVAVQWLHWNWTNLYECNQKLELCTSYKFQTPSSHS